MNGAYAEKNQTFVLDSEVLMPGIYYILLEIDWPERALVNTFTFAMLTESKVEYELIFE